MGVDQLRVEAGMLQGRDHGLDHEIDKMRGNDPADGGANHDRGQRIDDAFTQLDEMLEKRHLSAGLFGCCNYGGIRLAAVVHERSREGYAQAERLIRQVFLLLLMSLPFVGL